MMIISSYTKYVGIGIVLLSLFAVMEKVKAFPMNAEQDEAPKPLSPAEGKQLQSNTPILVWSEVEADSLHLMVDGNRMESLSGDRRRTAVFPLSFGRHEWNVIAFRDGEKNEGPMSHFSINDAPVGDVPSDALLLRNDWSIKSSILAGDNGKKLSGRKNDIEGWHQSSVPVTVLSALVRNGVYPNPYVGTNNLRIPDMSDEFNEEHNLLRYSHIKGENPWSDPYWFRKTFHLPDSFDQKNLTLHLNEINYRAEVWINGKQIADTSRIKGMERPFRLDVTDHVSRKKENVLLIGIYPPDKPGKPSPPPLHLKDHPGRNMGNGVIAKNYTKWDVLGWDWQPGVRDRDIGITEEVYITGSGSVKLEDVYVAADLNIPDTSFAYIRLATHLFNQTQKRQKGTLKGTIKAIGHDDPPTRFSYPVAIDPGGTKKVELTPHMLDTLRLENPRLWWPADWGQPNRYRLILKYETREGVQHHAEEIFGVRDIKSYMGNNERVYRINGEDVYMKGGNWVIDMMLNWNYSRYVKELKMAKNSGINMLRVWGPTGVPPEGFFRAADSLGIMIWQDFLNDYWGTHQNDPEYKPEKQLYYESSADMVKKLRNHPSLVIWSGGNEGPNQYESMVMHHILPKYDPWGGRHYLRISNGSGLHGGGPYHTIRPEDYYESSQITGFSSEIGPSGVPVLESLELFLPELGETWHEGRFPIYGDWGYHDANDRTGDDPRRFSAYDNIIREDYGAPETKNKKGVEDYARKSQLLNYDVYRATIEALNRQLWDASSGYALWKYNASWPSLTWQIFDWYLVPNAGYYGIQKANESRHIQFNRDNRTLSVINSLPRGSGDLAFTASTFDMKGNRIWSKSDSVLSFENGARETDWKVPAPENDGNPYFLFLDMKDSTGNTISRNSYWLDENNDFRPLLDMRNIELNVGSSLSHNAENLILKVEISNQNEDIAFFTEIQLIRNTSKEAIEPAFWTDNYITLRPGESKTIEAELPENTDAEDISLQWQGINISKEIQEIK